MAQPYTFRIAPDVLRAQLATTPILGIAKHYGVSYSTVWRRGHDLGLLSRRTRAVTSVARGPVLGSGKVEAALRAALPSDAWTPAATLRPHVPGSRQRLYQILARLQAEGQVERRGPRGAYEWRRIQPQEEPRCA